MKRELLNSVLKYLPTLLNHSKGNSKCMSKIYDMEIKITPCLGDGYYVF